VWRIVACSSIVLLPLAARAECTTSADCHGSHCVARQCEDVEAPHLRADDTMTVHVIGDSGAIVEHAVDLRRRWATLCVTPCDVLGGRANVYRLAARDNTVRPKTTSDDVWLRAQLGQSAPLALAFATAGVGVAAIGTAMGLTSLFASFNTYGSLCWDPSGCAAAPSWVTPMATVGIFVGVAGLALAAIGFACFHAAHKTELREISRPMAPILMPP
jgi:hypothetical protein